MKAKIIQKSISYHISVIVVTIEVHITCNHLIKTKNLQLLPKSSTNTDKTTNRLATSILHITRKKRTTTTIQYNKQKHSKQIYVSTKQTKTTNNNNSNKKTS